MSKPTIRTDLALSGHTISVERELVHPFSESVWGSGIERSADPFIALDLVGSSVDAASQVA